MTQPSRMTEFDRITSLRRRFERGGESAKRGVVLGIGDDGAVVDVRGPIVLSTDASIEGIHFRRDFGSLFDLGRRAVHAAVSDLAAMGAEPEVLLSSLTLPPEFADDAFESLIDGIATAAEDLGMTVVGGNLSGARELGISTTVVGRDVGATMRRDGARSGDGIFVTGPIGGAALGLASLLDGRARDGDAFVDAWRGVRARVSASRRVRELASACIDISDGLSADLAHLLDASGVGATIHYEQIPLPEGFVARCDVDGLDPEALILGGGEDYELLFTAACDAVPHDLATRIGTIVGSTGIRVVRAEVSRTLAPQGHTHP